MSGRNREEARREASVLHMQHDVLDKVLRQLAGLRRLPDRQPDGALCQFISHLIVFKPCGGLGEPENGIPEEDTAALAVSRHVVGCQELVGQSRPAGR